MSFLPKDYVGVASRLEKAHEEHKTNLSIETEFDIKDSTVIFTARVRIKNTDQIFVGHSFGEVGKEKAFEKLETVAVGRALAFAGYEVKAGIASREEMDVFQSKPRDLMDVINDIRTANDPNVLETLKDEGKTFAKSEKQTSWLKEEYVKKLKLFPNK